MKDAGFKTAVHFYNPNIHPLIEYRRRRKSVLMLAKILGLEIVDASPVNVHPGEFLGAADWRKGPAERCVSCYRMRLERTAAAAKLHGFDAFTTTLLVSNQQNRDAILNAGRDAAAQTEVQFLEADWRERQGKGGAMPSNFQPYRQQYCGCIMSEYERFSEGKQHLVPGEAGDEP